MSTVRTLKSGSRLYYYLGQSYRWEGEIRKKEVYLGTSVPHDLATLQKALDRAIWQETWFRRFDSIKAAYLARLKGLPKSVREEEIEDFVVEFTYDTNRIEGSTLSLEDTRLLLERGITPSSKPIRDVQETQLHAKLLRRLISRPEPVDLPHLLRWHRELFGETKLDIAGRLRDVEVRIRGSQHLPPTPLEVRSLLIELLRWSSRHATEAHPVELAAEFHSRFEHIHPFTDGNGRVGRIAMNVLLARQGFPMINIPYTKRQGYYRALELSSVRADSRPFLRWFFLRYGRENRFYLPR
jgi:Fic family protein